MLILLSSALRGLPALAGEVRPPDAAAAPAAAAGLAERAPRGSEAAAAAAAAGAPPWKSPGLRDPLVRADMMNRRTSDELFDALFGKKANLWRVLETSLIELKQMLLNK